MGSNFQNEGRNRAGYSLFIQNKKDKEAHILGGQNDEERVRE